MNTDGKKLIDGLCERLQDQGKPCTDSQIMTLLRSLDRYDVNQLVVFGTVDKWKIEKIVKERSLNTTVPLISEDDNLQKHIVYQF